MNRSNKYVIDQTHNEGIENTKLDRITDNGLQPEAVKDKTDPPEAFQETICANDPETKCGIGSCHPEGMQCCASVLPFSIFHGVTLLLTQAFSLYIASQITTIEKQYNLNSARSGILLSCNDIGFVITVLLVSHFGKRYHIPRILGVSVIIYAVAGVLSSLPQFISWRGIDLGASNVISANQTIDTNLCNEGYNESIPMGQSCAPTDTARNKGVNWVVIFLGICFAVQGVAKSPRNPLGTLYVDSNTTKTKTGFYLGIISTIGLFGPFIGLILGGVFATMPVDLKPTSLTPYDPRWIGAWWIGFLLIGGLALVCSIPVFFFPRRINLADDSEVTGNHTKHSSFCTELKDLPKSAFRILRKPVFLLNLLSVICIMLSIVAVNGFGPKYIETQFNRPTYEANITLGIQRIVTSAVGTFLGGVITRKLKLDRKGCMKMIVVLHLVECVFHSLQYVFGCENHIIHGEHGSSLDVQSTFGCGCDNAPYLAVCGTDGRTYYSPCFAGCTNVTSNVYGGCRLPETGSANPGVCQGGCNNFIPFIVISIVYTLAATMALTPLTLIFLRTVEEDDRAMAMGIVSFAMSLLAFIPGPILFGMLIDSTCRIWNSYCGTVGACALYDIVSMRHKLISADVGLNIASFALNVLTLIIVTMETRKMTKDKIDVNKGK